MLLLGWEEYMKEMLEVKCCLKDILEKNTVTDEELNNFVWKRNHSQQ